MGREAVRERDLGQLRDIVASLHAPESEVSPDADACWGAPVELLSRDPSGPGVRWASLGLLRELLHIENMCLQGMDSARQELFFVQEVSPDGPNDFFVQEVGPDGPIDPTIGLPDWQAQGDAHFWRDYWSNFPSFPERTGDWDTVYGSHMVGRKVAEELCRSSERTLDHSVHVAVPLGRARHLRLFGISEGWGTFSERERGCLELLKPHFADAWRRSCDTEPPLTGAQRRVLEQVRVGHTNRQVARDLGISEATVRTHLQNAYTALGVNNRVAAVAAAFGSPAPMVPARCRGGAG